MDACYAPVRPPTRLLSALLPHRDSKVTGAIRTLRPGRNAASAPTVMAERMERAERAVIASMPPYYAHPRPRAYSAGIYLHP